MTPEQRRAAGQLKNVLATYQDAEDLINIGAYRAGANPHIDYAISKYEQVNTFLKQETDEKVEFENIVEELEGIFNPDTTLE